MQAVIKPLNREMVMVLSEDILKTLGIVAVDTVEVDTNGVVRRGDGADQREVRLQRGLEFVKRYRETLDIFAK